MSIPKHTALESVKVTEVCPQCGQLKQPEDFVVASNKSRMCRDCAAKLDTVTPLPATSTN